jgi:alpha-L-fucosidase
MVMLAALALMNLPLGSNTPSGLQARMQWFQDAKLGIFIHWGIYAVKGIDESWSFFNGYISHEDYMSQLSGFTAKRYSPDKWATLIKASGARYAVLTAKHHDGVALWNTRQGSLSVVRRTPAQRDLVAPFCKALRRAGLKVGLYFSLLDWSHPDYPVFLKNRKRYDIDKDPQRWERFRRFNMAQIRELATVFRPDLFWFDGDWEQSAEAWQAGKIKQMLLDLNPAVIVNSRLQGHGDYGTPEQGVPVIRPRDKWWELCMTMNDSWGYQGNDTNYKSANQIIRIFIDCISMGGNLLLDIGPRADGTIPPAQVSILQELGRWTGKHSEAIFGTREGIPGGHVHGPTTLSRDGRVLYLFLPYKPIGPVAVKGLKNKVNRIRIVGSGHKLAAKILMKQYWSEAPGILYIDVPEKLLDPQVTVLALQLEGRIDLYRK